MLRPEVPLNVWLTLASIESVRLRWDISTDVEELGGDWDPQSIIMIKLN